MDLSEVCKKYLTIMDSYRGAKPYIAISYDFERSSWIAGTPDLNGKHETPEGAVRGMIGSAISKCKHRITDYKDQIAFEESMIGELEGLL